ncbi:hypothetical protein RBU49_04590 [Clostridium sp. MB40-C1]|uniref:hypothetical protein n=1 Tax=Clostridium sp. MB40-C1 TaxID=3070996 RepID=UPI0027E02901|nr:hypothetical protein [Clostridium sp. MB40-C1]WMJ81532.1 hypothetical protein RBU49_04590 [Clostridium sp. MB40-C1]
MNKKRSLIITFIGDINFLIALLSIASLFPGFLERFGFSIIQLPVFSHIIMRAIMSIILLIASYGFLKLKTWGYWLMVTYNMFFLVVFIISSPLNKYLIISTNVTMTFIELIFILPTKKYFYKKPFFIVLTNEVYNMSNWAATTEESKKRCASYLVNILRRKILYLRRSDNEIHR